MADKYQTLNLTDGRSRLMEATVVSTGSSQAGKVVGLGTDGKLDVSLMPDGMGPDVSVLETTEVLNAGAYVNIYLAAGVPKIRNADASNDRPAYGFVKVGYAVSGQAHVYYEGPNTAVTGLTIGARYFLGTSGAATATVPATPTAIISQFLGIAVSATSINTDIDDSIIL